MLSHLCYELNANMTSVSLHLEDQQSLTFFDNADLADVLSREKYNITLTQGFSTSGSREIFQWVVECRTFTEFQ